MNFRLGKIVCDYHMWNTLLFHFTVARIVWTTENLLRNARWLFHFHPDRILCCHINKKEKLSESKLRHLELCQNLPSFCTCLNPPRVLVFLTSAQFFLFRFFHLCFGFISVSQTREELRFSCRVVSERRKIHSHVNSRFKITFFALQENESREW